MTPAHFCKIGQLLYGPSWRGSLAHALEIGERSIYRLINSRSIKQEIVDKLNKLCRDRAAELLKAAEGMK